MKAIKKILFAAVLVVAATLVFSSCEKKNEGVSIVYQTGLFSFDGGSMTEAEHIKDIFYKAMGVTISPFVIKGNIEECDRRLIEQCKAAEKDVNDYINGIPEFNTHFRFGVYNGITEKYIYEFVK